ncbi:MAG: hypothetical protein Q7K21_02760 [Elusimicrobiota bacterium]|nr:hypothetical protein [Elusimicrobiota bacterium]
MIFLKDKKNPVILLLSILFIIKIPQEGLRFSFWVFGGVVLTSLFDVLATAILQKRIIVPKSAVISGFIVSGILDYRQTWFVLVIFSLLPVISKHILKFKHKHIFNPANFSLAIATFFKVPLTWNIESNIYLIILTGLYIVYSLKKIPHIIGFFVFFTGLFVTQKVNPFLSVSWFFVFIMLIEPKTSGYGFRRGLIFGGIAGMVSFIVFKFNPAYNPFISSLFVANLFNPILDKMK